MTRPIPLLLALLVGFALSAPNAVAQSNLSGFLGVGTATDSATGGCIYTGYTEPNGSAEPGGTCVYNSVPNGGYATPGLGGLFAKVGADYLFSEHFGVGAEYAFRFDQGPFGDVKYRANIYDFNLLWHPWTASGRFVPEGQGGVGVFDTRFYLPYGCGTSGCAGLNYFDKTDHLQIHGGVGIKIYLKGGIFIKPQFDFHYVFHLKGPVSTGGLPMGQFGSNLVPEYSVSVGYTFRKS